MTRQEHNREVSSHATCNWVEVRNQAAIAAMQGILSNAGLVDGQYEYRITVEKAALSYADELVKLLKGE